MFLVTLVTNVTQKKTFFICGHTLFFKKKGVTSVTSPFFAISINYINKSAVTKPVTLVTKFKNFSARFSVSPL